MIRSRKHNRAFTLIELLVCITIFVIMTALLMAKYGNFNQSVLLTNLAYETALQLRTAQNYGLSVKSVKDSSGADVLCNAGTSFQCAYGIEFDMTTPTQFQLFAEPLTSIDHTNTSGVDTTINTYTLKRGAKISGYCYGSVTVCTSATAGKLDIMFRRPDPTAFIYYTNSSSALTPYSKIIIKGTDGSTRSISVSDNGQISVDI